MAKRCNFVRRVNQSLLELAHKLRQAEVRVNGRALQAAVPPKRVSTAISSTVDRGRFQFIARRNDKLEDFTSAEYIENSDAAINADSAEEFDTANGFCTDDALEPVNTPSKKLLLPDRDGPSLWPFLSSIKASADIEHARFLAKNQRFYSNYNRSRIAEGYVEPLSETDFGIIIDSAIDAVLQPHESRVSQQSYSSRNEPSVSAPISAATEPLIMNTNVEVLPTLETDHVTTTPNEPAIVTKPYAATVANPRRFRCALCPYTTSNRSHVRRHHISVHSDARPYRCYVCSKEFARCENAKVHMVSRHPEVPYDMNRLRNSVFYQSDSSVPPEPTEITCVSPVTTRASDPKTVFQLQQNVAGCDMSAQLPSDTLEVELQRARLPQAIPPGLVFPKIEPKLDQSLPMFGHGQSLGGIPYNMLPANTNAVSNVLSLLASNTIKQEFAATKTVGYPSTDRHVCLYCQFVFQSAPELANHIATAHSSFSSAFHAAPMPNPGYVVLQTAAPIFLFPSGADSAVPNRSQVGQGYHPILPKLSGQSEESTPQKAQESQSSPKTATSSECKRERKRQFKTFYCTRCPERAPFRYEKSFEKHLKQHRYDDRAQKAQKLASKVA